MKRGVLFWCPSLLPPALQGLGWAVNVEGAVRGGSDRKKGVVVVLPSSLFSFFLLESPVAPPCRSVMDGWMDARMRVCVNGIGTRED